LRRRALKRQRRQTLWDRRSALVAASGFIAAAPRIMLLRASYVGINAGARARRARARISIVCTRSRIATYLLSIARFIR